MRLIFRRAVFDHDIPAFHEACFLEALAECDHEVRGVSERGVPQETHNRHRRLRACCERPSGYTSAEKRDEFPPPHGAHPKAKDHTGIIIAQCIAAKSDHSSPMGCTTRLRLRPRFCPRLRKGGVPPTWRSSPYLGLTPYSRSIRFDLCEESQHLLAYVRSFTSVGGGTAHNPASPTSEKEFFLEGAMTRKTLA